MMNAKMSQTTAPLAYVVGILGALFIVFFLVRAMQHYTQPAPLGSDRAAEREQNLTELRQAEAPLLNEYGWDEAKGLARLPIEQAMEQTVQLYKNPEAVRAQLIERSDIANAPPPEVPSEFE